MKLIPKFILTKQESFYILKLIEPVIIDTFFIINNTSIGLNKEMANKISQLDATNLNILGKTIMIVKANVKIEFKTG